MGITKERSARARKIIRIAILSIFLFCACCVIAASLSLIGGYGLFGYSARIVMSSSMENTKDEFTDERIREIRIGSFIVIRLVPSEDAARDLFYSEVREGDVLTFGYHVPGGCVQITHRVKKIERNGDGFTITLHGDNGNSTGEQVIDTSDVGSENRIIGKVVYCDHALGVFLCRLRDPPFLLGVCAAMLCIMILCAIRSRRMRQMRLSPSAVEGNMKNRIFALVLVLVIFCFAFSVGATYGLFDETISTQNHLSAGSLAATLVRQKLTTVNIDASGMLQRTVDEADKNFTADTQDNIFGLTESSTVAPGSSFTAEMNIKNDGNVAFYYYVEVYFNSVVSDQTFASMLKLTAESEKNVKQEAIIKDGLTLGADESGLGTVEAGGAETFTVKLEFLDNANNNKVEGKFVLFDLRIHAVQKIAVGS